MPSLLAARLLLTGHPQLLLEAEDLVLSASTNVDVEVFSASTCCNCCGCGGLLAQNQALVQGRLLNCLADLKRAAKALVDPAPHGPRMEAITGKDLS